MTESTLAVRWSQHKKVAKRGSPTALHAAIRKYGVASFSVSSMVSVLEGVGRDALCEIERLLIAQENTMAPAGYNMTPGGDGLPKGETNPNFGAVRSEKTRAKLRAGWTDARRAKLRETAKNPPKAAPLKIYTKDEQGRAERRADRVIHALAMVASRKITPEQAEIRNARIVKAAKSEHVRKMNSDILKQRRAEDPRFSGASHSVRMKQMWQDPIYRAKFLEARATQKKDA